MALLRPAEPRDLAAIAALQRDAILALAGGAYGQAGVEAWARWQEADAATLLDQDGAFLVVQDTVDETLLAVGGWRPDGQAATLAWVRAVFVAPRAARRGVGRLTMEAIERSCRASGRRDLALSASLNAEGFYARLGYTPLSRGTWTVEPGIALGYVRMRKGATA